jgi:ATP-dependent Clp protease ATP-binding subunit ClpC
MFERYTEKARRVIFFARYEASQFGAFQIEPEHILLGIIREDKKLAARFFKQTNSSVNSIRNEIEERASLRDRISTEIDMPLSEGAKRALSFAAEESELLGNRHIGTEHLLLGLLREENSIPAEILNARGLRLPDVRQDLARHVHVESAIRKWPHDAPRPEDRDDQWVEELSEACIDAGLFTYDELSAEITQVAALRQLEEDTEALLRMLAAKGLADPLRLPNLAFDLRDETKLAEFIKKSRQR